MLFACCYNQNMKNLPQNPKDTSWNSVARWYDELLKNDDSYQAKVILPNLLRILDLKKGEHILDLACGQGYFANIFVRSGAKVIASDLSKKLIDIAKKNLSKEISFYNSPAHKSPFIKDASLDIVAIVLAIQNIENINEVFVECKRILKQNGRTWSREVFERWVRQSILKKTVEEFFREDIVKCFLFV